MEKRKKRRVELQEKRRANHERRSAGVKRPEGDLVPIHGVLEVPFDDSIRIGQDFTSFFSALLCFAWTLASGGG